MKIFSSVTGLFLLLALGPFVNTAQVAEKYVTYLIKQVIAWFVKFHWATEQTVFTKGTNSYFLLLTVHIKQYKAGVCCP